MIGRMLRRQVLSLALAACTSVALADDGHSVVILVNTASADSEAVGAHYARKRGVPETHICRVKCTTSETISRRQFNAKIRGPLRKFLIEQKLASEGGPGGSLVLRVKYLVSAYGVPVKVREDHAGLEPGSLLRNPRRRNAAAVDAELSLIALPKYPLEGGLPNPLYKAPRVEKPFLFATRLDGPTPQIAKGLVDAAMRAEENGLFGVGYIDTNAAEHERYQAGDQWMSDAAAALSAAGFFTRVDRTPETFDPAMPMPHAAFYFGWYAKTLCGPMAKSGFRFVPGAIAYHLHSGSAARLRTKKAGWAGPLLAKGATATMGAVFEPYLSGTVDVGEFTRLFLAGKTFGESAFLATPQVSWMMTFVGDPLYAPFRADRRGAALVNERNRVWRDIYHAVRAAEKKEFDRALKICSRHDAEPRFVELAARIHFQAGRGDEGARLYRKLAELVKDKYSSVQAYAVIGDSLVQSGKKEAAMGTYKECIRKHPRSPHVLPIYRKALRLARQLQKAETEVALWEGLATGFPGRPLGCFAAGELWARGLRKECRQPRVSLKQTEEKPVIDGRPDDPAWQGAAVIDELPHHAGPQRGAPRVRVRFTYDESALYVLAEMRSDPSGPSPYGRAPGDGTFDLILSPWRDAERVVRITIPRKTPAAAPLKGVVWRVGVLGRKEDGGASNAGWLVELAIPFAALGVMAPPRDAVWAANFVQTHTVPKFPFRVEPSLRSWAEIGTDPFAPERAGYLMFK